MTNLTALKEERSVLRATSVLDFHSLVWNSALMEHTSPTRELTVVSTVQLADFAPELVLQLLGSALLETTVLHTPLQCRTKRFRALLEDMELS